MHVLALDGYTNVRGVDISPAQVAMAQGGGVRNVTQDDIFAVLGRIGSASQDVVVAFDVIEHLTKSELEELFNKVGRVLKPSGRWIIHTPNGESPFVGRMRYGDITHETVFTRVSLSRMLEAFSFRDIRCFEDRPVVHGIKSAARSLLWRAIRSVLLMYIAVETGSVDRNAIFSQNFTAVAYR